MRRRTFIGSILASSVSAFGITKGLAQDNKPHIAVIGAGAFGGWTALHLLRAGAKVTLLDAWGPGNSRASSGGESRVIRHSYDKAIYVDKPLAFTVEDAREILTSLLERQKRSYVPGAIIGRLYHVLGEDDLAFEWFETAYRERDASLPWLRWASRHPGLERLPDDPRYKDLLRRMNVPEPR